MMLCMICDDQKSELETVQKLVAGYAEAHPDLLLSVRCFSSPFDMLDEIDRSGAPDIALLDICMPGVLGTEVVAGNPAQKPRCNRYCFPDQQPGLCGRGLCSACRRLSHKALHEKETGGYA